MNIIERCQEYGLSYVSAITIKECVESYQKYENLPQATKDDIQIISDMFNVSFSFTLLKRGKLALTGIFNDVHVSYLYTDETLQDRKDKKHYPKNPQEYILNPNSDHVLKKVA